jgi:uncharacterized protein
MGAAAKNNQSWQKDERIRQLMADRGVSAQVGPGQTGRPGHSDGTARLADMDADRVAVEVVYCEVSAYRYLYSMREGSEEATIAFNDSMAEFASPAPNRLIVSSQIPIDDIDFAVREVERVASRGGKSLQLPVLPAELGHPDYWHPRYDPLWSAIQDSRLPICCHIGLNTRLNELAERDPTPQKAIVVPITAMSTAEALGMWVMTGIFEKFPRLKVVFVEPGLGWIAWWLFTMDDMRHQGYEYPALKRLPSEYFHDNVFVTFIDEPDVLHSAKLLDRIGLRNLLWSTDYPHPVTTWPRSQAAVETAMGHLPPDARELLTSANAKRVWNL